jgi:hypothetical protein
MQRHDCTTVSPSPAYTGEGKQQQMSARVPQQTSQPAEGNTQPHCSKHRQHHRKDCPNTFSSSYLSVLQPLRKIVPHKIAPKIFCLPLFLSIKIISKSIFVAIQERSTLPLSRCILARYFGRFSHTYVKLLQVNPCFPRTAFTALLRIFFSALATLASINAGDDVKNCSRSASERLWSGYCSPPRLQAPGSCIAPSPASA